MNQIKKGIILSYVYMVINILIGIVKVPIFISMVGKSEYGLYQLVFSIINYVTIFESSISTAVLKYFTKYKSKNDMEAMENTLSSAWQIFKILYIFIIFLALIIILLFEKFYANSLNSYEIRQAKILIIMAFFNIIITIASSLYLTALTSFERFSFIKLLLIFADVFQFVFTIIAIKIFPYAKTIVLVGVLINLLVALARYLYVGKNLNIRIKKHKEDRLLQKQILIFASTIILSSIADQIFWNTDQVILAKLFGTSVVAIYSVGGLIANIFMRLGLQIFTVFFPRLGNINESEQKMQLFTEIFIKVGRICFILTYLILTGFIFFGKEFIYIWLGKGFDDAFYVALFIMIPLMIDLIEHLGLMILQIIDKYNFRSYMFLLAAILNIGLTIILSKQYGMVGAAIATGVSMFVVSGIIMNIYYQKIGIDIISFFKGIFIMILKFSPLYILALLLNLIFKDYNMFLLIIKICIYSLSYLILLLKYVSNKNEKEMIKSILGKIKIWQK